MQHLIDADIRPAYLLISSSGAITHFHTDHSGTCVMYSLIKGEKDIYFVPASEDNKKWFREFLKLPESMRLKHFFGSHIMLDPECRMTTLHEGQTLFMGPDLMHMVVTRASSISVGINFAHTSTIPPLSKNEWQLRHMICASQTSYISLYASWF